MIPAMPLSIAGFSMARLIVLLVGLSTCLSSVVQAMRQSHLKQLRMETERMFYHGFDNYMQYAFPEDELRPLTCGPLTRGHYPTDSSLLDVLGNYSLTMVDTLSSLAVFANADPNTEDESARKAWSSFQNAVKSMVELYGDGTDGPKGRGSKSAGFAIDSKVQVFETIIRGVGGLLSAHLFAVGDLPIREYHPKEEESSYAKLWNKSERYDGHRGIRWNNGFVYDGQLLRLAWDLAVRMLPAFYTPTGLPYPRIDLLRGVPFYRNSIFNIEMTKKHYIPPETSETCSAGAGSLVLEFTVLSRLTGDGRFEEMAKRAFWAVWHRRTDIGLLGNGVDAESGKWLAPYTGIGAGIDSFFEYAIKAYVLLSRGERPSFASDNPFSFLDDYFETLSEEEHAAESFLAVWKEAMSAVKHHLYRGAGYQYPHYIQGDVFTGATRAFWIDALSAYFPGALTLSGDVEGAAETHLLHTALWDRFASFPERWNVATGEAELGMEYWAGRPEFIESNYYLYRATEDPWYLYVGEMALRDIKRRCWTECGWAGLLNVHTGEKKDRMESFFLGETAKYLYLLFEPDHPLNRFDGPFVFSTEAHPLIIPSETVKPRSHTARPENTTDVAKDACPAPLAPLPFGASRTAARPDLFHAASLVRLHLMPPRAKVESPIFGYTKDHPSITHADLFSPSNYTFFPWTLPPQLVPFDARSAPMVSRPTLDLSFPTLPNSILGSSFLDRVQDGIYVKSIGGLRLGMVQNVPSYIDNEPIRTYRIQAVNNIPLGKDERVYMSKKTTSFLDPIDPNFSQLKDSVMLDLVIDLDPNQIHPNESSKFAPFITYRQSNEALPLDVPIQLDGNSMKLAFTSFVNHVASLLKEETLLDSRKHDSVIRFSIPAITASGAGAEPFPDFEEATFPPPTKSSPKKHLSRPLSWSTVYMVGDLCSQRLPLSIPQEHQIIVVKRGGCSFSTKLANIPCFRSNEDSLQLVVVVSYPESDGEQASSYVGPPDPEYDETQLIRPLLHEPQTVLSGIPRPKAIPMVLVDGGERTYRFFEQAQGVGVTRRYQVQSQGVPIDNLILI